MTVAEPAIAFSGTNLDASAVFGPTPEDIAPAASCPIDPEPRQEPEA